MAFETAPTSPIRRGDTVVLGAGLLSVVQHQFSQQFGKNVDENTRFRVSEVTEHVLEIHLLEGGKIVEEAVIRIALGDAYPETDLKDPTFIKKVVVN